MTREIRGVTNAASGARFEGGDDADSDDCRNKSKKMAVFSMSSSRLLCLIMALDLMTLSVQVWISCFHMHGLVRFSWGRRRQFFGSHHDARKI